MPKSSSHTRSRMLLPTLVLRSALCVAAAAAAEHALILLQNRHPEWMRTASLGLTAVFALFAVTYLYWAFRFSSSDGYRASTLRRVGLVISALGAALVSAKFGLPHIIPGPSFAYFFSALFLAYVIRPFLDRAGLKTQQQASIGM